MKKKMLMVGALLSVAAIVTSCGGRTVNDNLIYLITDVGNIDDKSFNQSAWEGVQEFGKTNEKQYKYLRPTEDSTNARVEQIETAYKAGAKVVVMPGFLFAEAAYIEQEACPDMNFIFIDGTPAKGEDSKIAANTTCLFYNEIQAGWLAGYFTAKEYDTGKATDTVKLGFFGGVGVGAVIRYGLGFCAGIQHYTEVTTTSSKFAVNYNYSGSFVAKPEFVTTIEGWYTDGVECVFSCGGSIYTSVLQAAKNKNKKLIGVDSDQGLALEEADKPYMLTSAMKGVKASTELALKAMYDNKGTLPADYSGKSVTYSAKNDGVSLGGAESWKFSKSTHAEYETLFTSVKTADAAGNTDSLYVVDQAKDPDKQGFTNVTVNYIK